ncbi:MAG TPA: UDP-N-acetylglucosamine 1-carboxyvinyltransferase [Patescibacteria group bacterium]|nr:UDP-N-acetylglucosamine 1-carboxyvinyltransferase [Patescibacteria group bacterium]
MNIRIKGGQKLNGEIDPSGSKNSAVAIIPATLLFDEPVEIQNVPDITDVTKMVTILEKLGSIINWDKENSSLLIDNRHLSFEKVDKDDWSAMRGTSLLWGPMLARFGKVDFSGLPGGCTLGYRTLLPHYQAFEDLGVKVNLSSSGIVMDAGKAHSNSFWLTEMSPTATENAVSLAVTLKGKTEIVGAASEPQVQDFCNFLNSAGSDIQGIGSNLLTINGNHSLSKTKYRLLSDHYEIATFLALSVVTKGVISVHNAEPDLFRHINYIFSKFGLRVHYNKNTAYIPDSEKVKIIPDGEGRDFLTVKAQPWPSLPVDLLPIFIPIALSADRGVTLFHNWMYDSGLFWTSELTKLGANIIMCDQHRIITVAGSHLHGDTLEAPYIIRAVVAMVMACMMADGESIILNADSLYRGHPHFSDNLKKLGANIEEIS